MNKPKEGYHKNMEMDYLTATCSIFSFDHLDEFVHLSPLESFRQQEDVTLSSFLQEGADDPVVIPSPRQRKQRSRKGLTAPETCQGPKDNNTDKKVIHRDIERLRRQEMALLYGSLRSRLPLELLKGKRSISDHIHQAVNYIQHQRNKIRVLSEKRDGMKRRMESRDDQTDSGELSETCYDPRDTVVINPCMEGVEIMINTCWRQGIPLSKIIQVLMRGGLDVIRTNSGQMNDRVIYSIHAEIEDRGKFNLAELHQKLMSLRPWRSNDTNNSADA